MDCVVAFGDEETVLEVTLRFLELPRLGERVSFRDGTIAYTGLVSGIEHLFSPHGPHSVTIDVERD